MVPLTLSMNFQSCGMGLEAVRAVNQGNPCILLFNLTSNQPDHDNIAWEYSSYG